MTILRFILAMLVTPIILLGNLFKHKDNLLEWHLDYDEYIVTIKTKYMGMLLPDGLLISCFILFLARYFLICEKPQIEVMKSFLNNEIGKEIKDYQELSLKISDLIIPTLNEFERQAFNSIFRMGRLPYCFYEDKKLVSKPLAHFSFLVYGDKEVLMANFHMSTGPTIVLLPLTVTILYCYVVHKLTNKGNKDVLDKSVLDFINLYDTAYCRSMIKWPVLPNAIIKQNKIEYVQSM